jgi:hypothetical protein
VVFEFLSVGARKSCFLSVGARKSCFLSVGARKSCFLSVGARKFCFLSIGARNYLSSEHFARNSLYGWILVGRNSNWIPKTSQFFMFRLLYAEDGYSGAYLGIHPADLTTVSPLV